MENVFVLCGGLFTQISININMWQMIFYSVIFFLSIFDKTVYPDVIKIVENDVKGNCLTSKIGIWKIRREFENWKT